MSLGLNSIKYVVLAATVLLSGCVTQSAVQSSLAKPVQQTNLLPGYAQYAEAKPGTSRVVVVRDMGLIGSAVKMNLSVNGVPVAKFWTGERLELFMPPATYSFNLVPEPNFFDTEQEDALYEIKADRQYGFRITIGDVGAKFHYSEHVLK